MFTTNGDRTMTDQAKMTLDGWAIALSQVTDLLQREVLTNYAADHLDVRRAILRKVVANHAKAGVRLDQLVTDPEVALLLQFPPWRRPYVAEKVGVVLVHGRPVSESVLANLRAAACGPLEDVDD
jgi:hypothetical protein